MKKILLTTIFCIIIAPGCDGWEYTVPTFPAPPPTITPAIFTPTPRIVTATSTNTAIVITNTPTDTATPEIPTETATVFFEDPPPADTPVLPSLSPIITVEVLGCNTSIDITHGMGEVTNAFITLINNTGTGLFDICTTLNALDEGRIHPDKTVCIPQLEHGQQVTLKLTVDSTYRQETPIQVEVKDSDILLSRVDSPSCTNIGLFAPNPSSLQTPEAIP